MEKKKTYRFNVFRRPSLLFIAITVLFYIIAIECNLWNTVLEDRVGHLCIYRRSARLAEERSECRRFESHTILRLGRNDIK